jgi:prephenate dehydrogenase
MALPTVAIVGVGLIGGSVGLAARRRSVAARVRGTDRDPETLHRALAAGALDETRDGPAEAACGADLVFVCAPVDRVAELAAEAGAGCRPGAVVTDVGSTKAAILEAVRGRLPPGVAFVGGHPLAGSEKQGPEHARADLFEGRLVVLTPEVRTDESALARVREFWQAVGARVRLMEAGEHDQAVALTSHLPHLLASALAGILPPDLYELTATGFRDTSRLAAGSPAVWTPILRANRAAVLDALALLELHLGRFRQALAGETATLNALLQLGKTVRDHLGDGPVA